jgi:tRNA threonylcarbamoyl adenosine modification protein YeaZ
MKLLCLDTTLNNCAAQIILPGKITPVLRDKTQPPSDIISFLVNKSLSDSSLNISDLDGVIVTTGPGNFTSLRVGISFGVGLSKGLAIPIYGISSLQAIMFSHKKNWKEYKNFLVTAEARGNDYFFQLFDNLSNPISDPIKTSLEEAKIIFFNNNLFFVGSGSLGVAKTLGQEKNIICDNDEIDFLLVFEGMKKNISYYQNNLQPVYLSDPVAEKKDPLWFAKKKI